MRDWLIGHGIAAERIIAEDTSKDTQENLEHAAAILQEQGLGNRSSSSQTAFTSTGIAAGETCRTAIGKRVCQDEPSVCAYLLGAGVDGTVSASGAGAWLRKQLHKARMQSRQAGFMVRY